MNDILCLVTEKESSGGIKNKDTRIQDCVRSFLAHRSGIEQADPEVTEAMIDVFSTETFKHYSAYTEFYDGDCSIVDMFDGAARQS